MLLAKTSAPAEQMLQIPTELVQDCRRRLPNFTPELFAQILREGWSGVGVVPVILDLTDENDPKTLLLTHRKSGLLGLMSETVKGDCAAVETVNNTQRRAFNEELAIDDPISLDLLTPSYGGWVTIQARKNRCVPAQYLCGVITPLYVTSNGIEEIAELTDETSEIIHCEPKRMSELFAIDDASMRPFAKPALLALKAAGLLVPPSDTHFRPFDPPVINDQIYALPDFGTTQQTVDLSPVA